MGYDVLRFAAVGAILGLAGCEFIAGLNTHERRAQDAGVTSTCSDGIQNGKETDVDCGGGQCPACEQDRRCLVGADCQDRVCVNGACAAPTCSDKAQNGNETDIDCGGPSCVKCSAGKGCEGASDCVSGICNAEKCASSCTDQVKDGDESDIDCGGECPGCALGRDCGKNADCASGICETAKCVDFVESVTRMGGTSGTDRTWLAGLGVDTSGNTVVAANFSGKASFGGTSVYDAGQFSYGFAFARYDPVGKYLWDKGFVGGDPLVAAFAANSSGEFVAFGTFTTPLSFGNGFTTTNPFPGMTSAFYARFSAANVAEWAQSYGGTNGVSFSAFNGIAVSASGVSTVVIGSGKWGSYKVGTTTVSNSDMYVAMLPSGWGVKYNDGGSSDALVGVAFDSSSNVVLAGHHEGTINFGGGPDAGASGQGFVLKLTSTGNYTWARSFTAAPDGLAVDANGDVVVCGHFTGGVDFGDGVLSAAGLALFVAKLDGASGTAIWSKAFTASDPTATTKMLISTDSAGNILIGANTSSGTIDVDGAQLAGSILLVKLDPSGTVVWGTGFGVPPKQVLQGIAAYSEKKILVGGKFTGALTIGAAQPVTSIGAEDVFLARLRVP